MQTKMQSAIETVVSTAVGFGLSFVLNILVLPLVFGVHPSTHENLAVTSVFTVASLARGFAMRRVFAHWHRA